MPSMTVDACMMNALVGSVPHSGEPHPQEPIRCRQFRTLHGTLQDSDLMAQRKNLQ